MQVADQLKKQQEFAKVTGVPITPTPLLKQQAEFNDVPTTFDRFANYYFEKFHKRKVSVSTYRVAMSNYKNHVYPHFGDALSIFISSESSPVWILYKLRLLLNFFKINCGT